MVGLVLTNLNSDACGRMMPADKPGEANTRITKPAGTVAGEIVKTAVRSVPSTPNSNRLTANTGDVTGEGGDVSKGVAGLACVNDWFSFINN